MEHARILPRLGVMLDAIPVPVFIKDCAGRYIGSNTAFSRLAGLDRDKIAGRTVFDLFSHRAAQEMCEQEQELLRRGGMQTQETTMVAPDSSLRHVIIHRQVYTNDAGEPSGVIGAVIDVTEVKRLKEQVREGSSELELRLKVRTAELTRSYDELLRRTAEYKRRYDERSVPGSAGDIPSFVRIAGLCAEVADLKADYERKVALRMRAYARRLAQKDGYRADALARSARLSAAIARRMALPVHSMDILERVLDVYDIGKSAIPDEILGKSGKLTAAEMRVVRKHAHLGAEAVAAVAPFKDTALCVLSHHEHWDGSGYPAGSQGEQIPLEARVLAVVDTYKALTAPRPYRGPFPRCEAVKTIADCAGRQFDPRVVRAFLDIMT